MITCRGISEVTFLPQNLCYYANQIVTSGALCKTP